MGGNFAGFTIFAGKPGGDVYIDGAVGVSCANSHKYMQETMLTSRPEPAHRLRAGGLTLLCMLAALATCWLSPNRAQASCGDYVVVVNPSADYARNRPLEHPAQSGTPACPCQGPQCRSSDPTPLAPPSVSTTPGYEAAVLSEGSCSQILVSGFSNLDNWSILSEAYLLIPDPPPRSLS